MVIEEETSAAVLSSDHTPQEKEFVGIHYTQAVPSAHYSVCGESMHVFQGGTGDANGFRFTGVVDCVWCDGAPEVHTIVDHSVMWNFLEPGTVKAKHCIELIHVHNVVNAKKPELNPSPIFPIYRP